MKSTLPSEKSLRIEELIITPTKNFGILAGCSDYIAKRVRSTLREDIAEACHCSQEIKNKMLIIDENKRTLPKFRIIVWLIANYTDGWSELLVCWFTDDISLPVTDLIATKITDEHWQKNGSYCLWENF